MRNLRLALFVLLVVGAGFATGFANPPGGWYAALAKPWFNPPNWIFAPVWSIVYLLVAIAGWRTWERDRNSVAMTLWWAQMALNLLWSPVFFTAHWPAVALADIAGRRQRREEQAFPAAIQHQDFALGVERAGQSESGRKPVCRGAAES